ncbi:MAG: hypothetical protein IPO44_18480 [Candidatus Microthrix sp.]|nr:hypothetical protein [Candidatus Microthrix sp.]
MSEANGRPVPVPTPETQHFWDGTRAGRLLLQRCNACDQVYFPPRPFCPVCSCREVEVFLGSGEASQSRYVGPGRPGPGGGAGRRRPPRAPPAAPAPPPAGGPPPAAPPPPLPRGARAPRSATGPIPASRARTRSPSSNWRRARG